MHQPFNLSSYNVLGGYMKNTLSGFGKVNLQQNSASSKPNNDVNLNNINKDIMQEYDKIKDLSQEEASNRLYQEVFKQKQNGSFDFNALQNQVEGLKGYLPEKDYQNLKRILQTLK